MGGVWINDGRGPEMLIVVEWLIELRLPMGRPCGSMDSSWNWDRKCQASEDPRECWAMSGCLANTGFHSVGSTSVESSCSAWTRIVGGFVGVMGATMIGGEVGGVEEGDAKEDTEEPEDIEAERGLQESFRRQLESVSTVSRLMAEKKTYLSLQYRRELSGVVICVSHMALWGVSIVTIQRGMQHTRN